MRHEPAENHAGLAWPPLVSGRLVRRYKRFLADIVLDDGVMVTAHCPNSGSMTGCCQPGQPVYLSCHDDPRRKLRYTWELIEMPSSLVGVNTMVPNRLVLQSIRDGLIPALRGYTRWTPEFRVNPRTRLDFRLSAEDRADCFVEVKNCTLVEDGVAYFPDAPTLRGRKHLRELVELHAQGARGVIFFLVQRCDARAFAPADGIDPAYGQSLRQAAAAGVEILVYDVVMDLRHIALNRRLPLAMTAAEC